MKTSLWPALLLLNALLLAGGAADSAGPLPTAPYATASWAAHLGPLRRHLRTAAQHSALPHRVQPRLLAELPNNYGNYEHANISISSACSEAIEVAIMFFYNEYGDPEDCKYRDTWFDGTALFCIDYWHTIQPGETVYLADTAYFSWYFTAHSLANPAAGWGSQEIRNLRWQACTKNTAGCYGWDAVEVGDFEGGEEAPPLTLTCPKVDTDVTPLHLWDVWYDWPHADSSAPFTVEAVITVLKDTGPSHYFMSHFLSFTDKLPAGGAQLPDGAAAYVGLQTWGSNGRGAIFNVWGGASGQPDSKLAAQADASGRPAGRCLGFDNEGSGWQCFASLDWEAGVEHTFAVSLLRREAGGDTLRATVAGSLRGADFLHVIGHIFVPAFYGTVASSVYFYEYYAPLPSCAAMPPAEVQFSGLTMTAGDDRLQPALGWANMPTEYPCAGYASLSICATTVSGASPLATPVDPSQDWASIC